MINTDSKQFKAINSSTSSFIKNIKIGSQAPPPTPAPRHFVKSESPFAPNISGSVIAVAINEISCFLHLINLKIKLN